MESSTVEENRRYKTRGKTSRLVIPVICTMSFVTPDGLSFVGLSNIENLWRLGLIGVFVGMVIVQVYRSLKGKGIPFDSIFGLSFLLCIVYAFCTFANNGSFPHYSERLVGILGPWFLIAVFGYQDSKRFLKALFIAFFILAVANFIAVLYMYPHGSFRPSEGDFWLFGQRNAMRNIILPALLFSWIQDKINRKRYSKATLFLMVTSPIVIVLVQSSTTLLLVVLLETLMVLSMFGMSFSKIFKYFLSAYAVLEIVIVLMRKIDIFRPIIVNIFNRDITLSSRIDIWDVAIESIMKSPWVGTGWQSLEYTGLYSKSLKNFSNVHNTLIDVLYKGGIFGLILYVILFVRCCIPLFDGKNKELSFMIGSVLGCFLLAGITGDLWQPEVFLILFMAAYKHLWSGLVPDNQKNGQNFDKASSPNSSER